MLGLLGLGTWSQRNVMLPRASKEGLGDGGGINSPTLELESQRPTPTSPGILPRLP